MSRSDIQKINSVRLILEAEALRLARFHLTSAALARLDRMVQSLDESRDPPGPQRVLRDFEFHRSLWRLSRNRYLVRILETLTEPVFVHAEESLRKHRRRWKLISHRPLLDFLRGNSPRQAEDVLEEHLLAYW